MIQINASACRAACSNAKLRRPGREGALELQGLLGRRGQPVPPFLGLREDDGHGFGVDRRNFAIGRAGQETEDLRCHLAFLQLAHRGPFRPQTGEEGERSILAQSEPDR